MYPGNFPQKEPKGIIRRQPSIRRGHEELKGATMMSSRCSTRAVIRDKVGPADLVDEEASLIIGKQANGMNIIVVLRIE